MPPRICSQEGSKACSKACVDIDVTTSCKQAGEWLCLPAPWKEARDFVLVIALVNGYLIMRNRVRSASVMVINAILGWHIARLCKYHSSLLKITLHAFYLSCKNRISWKNPQPANCNLRKSRIVLNMIANYCHILLMLELCPSLILSVSFLPGITYTVLGCCNRG